MKATRSDWLWRGGGVVVLGPVSDTTEEPDRWEPVGREDKRTRLVGAR